MKRRNPNWAKRVSGAGLAIGASAALFGAQGCLDRPVVPIEPQSNQLVTQRIRVTRVDKLDLLLVVDNSISMADKQSELGRRIPELIAALTDPTPDPTTGRPTNVIDMHVGVISSSLGSHGTSACLVSSEPHNDDRGHLLPRAGEGGGTGWQLGAGGEPEAAPCPSPVAASALTWVFDPARDPSAMFKGTDGAKTLEAATSCVVQSVDQKGCGYEATWEAAYHFLVDPAPYLKAEAACELGVSGDFCGDIQVSGVDEELLQQRKAFLRDDSLLAVLILSDENDASLRPAGLNWLPWGYAKGAMRRGWAGCANVPDDFEPDSDADRAKLFNDYKCLSCFQDGSDPNCSVPWAADPLNNDVDGRNLRSFAQVQRFGYNFLYGRQRYVDAFSKATLTGNDGKSFTNPIFKGGQRDPSLVVVAGIVGVPRNLVSNEDGTPKVLTDDDWDKIVGPIGKRDPHMIESIKPRDGIAKFMGDRSVDAVNGGDRDVLDGDDLQYACIAPRAITTGGQDCLEGAEPEKNNPLCDGKDNQPYFKAYPGLRHLRIIRELGASGFVASICNDSFRPAIVGITEKLKEALNSQCLNSNLPAADDGTVNCLILESLKEDTNVGKRCEDIGPGLCTPGAEPCRVEGSDYPPTDPQTAAEGITLNITVVGADGAATTEAVTAESDGVNVYVTGTDNKKHQVCEIAQIARIDPAAGQQCVNDPAFNTTTIGGWCYSTKPDVVGETCRKRGAPGTIRFFGSAEPRNGSEVFTLCVR